MESFLASLTCTCVVARFPHDHPVRLRCVLSCMSETRSFRGVESGWRIANFATPWSERSLNSSIAMETLKKDPDGSAGSDQLGEEWSLAFASISTDDFAFDTVLATLVLAEELETTLKKVNGDNVRFVLVDPKAQLSARVLPKQVRIVTDSDATLLTPKCRVVAVGCNKLFKPAGDALNVALHKALDNKLESLTRVQYPNQSAAVGRAFTTNIPSELQKQVASDLEFVIQVLGPNMNPNRLDYLNNDYVKGEQQLRIAYRALFNAFLDLAIPNRHNVEFREISRLCHNAEVKNVEIEKKSEDRLSEYDIPPFRPPSNSPPQLPGLSLRAFMKDNLTPAYKQFVWFTHKSLAVIYDGYPKASLHVLIVHKSLRLDAIGDATSEHLDALREMHSLGRAIALCHCNGDARIGYHAKPSLVPLHLHIISADLSGQRLNSKKHWNSFMHPELFVPFDRVESNLAAHGKVKVLSWRELHDMEKATLRCWACGMVPHAAGSQKDALAQLKAHKCARALPSLT